MEHCTEGSTQPYVPGFSMAGGEVNLRWLETYSKGNGGLAIAERKGRKEGRERERKNKEKKKKKTKVLVWRMWERCENLHRMITELKTLRQMEQCCRFI